MMPEPFQKSILPGPPGYKGCGKRTELTPGRDAILGYILSFSPCQSRNNGCRNTPPSGNQSGPTQSPYQSPQPTQTHLGQNDGFE